MGIVERVRNAIKNSDLDCSVWCDEAINELADEVIEASGARELVEALEALLIAYCDPGNQGSDYDEEVEAARAALSRYVIEVRA